MHQLVQEYFDKMENKKQAVSAKKKEDLLLRLGLFEKQYTDKKVYSEEFPCSESIGNGDIRYYKKIPISVSDEEYARLLSYQKDKGNEKNITSVFLKIIAWVIFIASFIAGIALGSLSYDFNIVTALGTWLAGLVSGLMFYGFGEVIQLLNDIKNK